MEKDLHAAVETADIDMVISLLSQGINVNSKNTSGLTPLIIACAKGYLEIVKLLLLNQADPNINAEGRIAAMLLNLKEKKIDFSSFLKITTIGNKSALYEATLRGHNDIMELLLQKGANVNFQDQNGWTPLMIAAQQGNLTIVKMLIDSGADRYIQSKEGENAASLARASHHKDIIQLLNSSAQLSFSEAVTTGETTLVSAILESGDTRQDQLNQMLLLAVKYGKFDTTSLLLSHHADPNTCDFQGLTPLMLAATEDRLDIIQLLLSSGSNVDTKEMQVGRTALSFAATKGHANTLDFLIKMGADINITDGTHSQLLENAVESGDVDAVQIMIDADADVNYQGEGGAAPTPLMIAAHYGFISIARLLIKYGANIYAQDLNGRDAFDWANTTKLQDNAELIELLK